MIIYLATAAISIALIFGFIVYKRQTRSDHSFIDNLKKEHDVESLRVQVINEKVGKQLGSENNWGQVLNYQIGCAKVTNNWGQVLNYQIGCAKVTAWLDHYE